VKSLAIGLSGIGIAALLSNDKLRGTSKQHDVRLRDSVATVHRLANESLTGPCKIRKRKIIYALNELAVAHANDEWVGVDEEVEIAFDALMIAQRNWQASCEGK